MTRLTNRRTKQTEEDTESLPLQSVRTEGESDSQGAGGRPADQRGGGQPSHRGVRGAVTGGLGDPRQYRRRN